MLLIEAEWPCVKIFLGFRAAIEKFLRGCNTSSNNGNANNDDDANDDDANDDNADDDGINNSADVDDDDSTTTATKMAPLSTMMVRVVYFWTGSCRGILTSAADCGCRHSSRTRRLEFPPTGKRQRREAEGM